MVRILSDSGCDMTLEYAKSLGVEIVPLKVSFGDELYKDAYDIDHDTFFEKLIESDVLPQTSQVTPFEYEEFFAKGNEEDEIICITISSKLSGCYGSAVIAAEDSNRSIFVVDSLNACVGQRILVERAVQLRDEGLSGAEIAKALDEEKKNIRIIALLDTLEYLKKGGRISAAAAMAGTFLSIKPVICISEGEIKVLGKARGSKNGCNMLTEFIKKEGPISFDKPYCLAYSGLSDKTLRKYINDSAALYEDRVEKEKLPISSIGSAIGTHIGPGGIAVTFFV